MAVQTSVTVEIAAQYAELVADGLILLGIIPGVGAGLAAVGVALRQASITTEDVATQVMQVMQIAWQGFRHHRDRPAGVQRAVPPPHPQRLKLPE